MPSYAIHTAIGEVYAACHPTEDRAALLKGVLAPDLLPKPQSHYGPASSQPDLDRYKAEAGLEDSYHRGYYLHLLSDKLFFDVFLTSFSKELYRDYDKVNAAVTARFGVTLPPEVTDAVAYEEGEPTLFQKEDLFAFIEAVGKADLFADYDAIVAAVKGD